MSNATVDKLIKRVWLEVERVGWFREDVRAYLEITYQERAVTVLTEQQLMQFIGHLQNLPNFKAIE